MEYLRGLLQCQIWEKWLVSCKIFFCRMIKCGHSHSNLLSCEAMPSPMNDDDHVVLLAMPLAMNS
jgi:hypothetical protein